MKSQTIGAIGLVIIGCVATMCDRIEEVEFTPEVGELAQADPPVQYEAGGVCMPGDALMPYPLSHRDGLTEVLARPSGPIMARRDDCRTYYHSETGWKRTYGGEIEAGESLSLSLPSDYITPPGEPGLLCMDYWFFPGTQRLASLLMLGPDFWACSSEDCTVPTGGVEFRDGGGARGRYLKPFESIYGEPMGDEVILGDWYAQIWGTPKDAFLMVGGRAFGPELPDGALRDFTDGATRLTGSIWRYNASDDKDLEWGVGDITPLNHSPDLPLVDIWGNSMSDYWVVGNILTKECPRMVGKVFHCNDTACKEELSVAGAFLKSIDGSSSHLFVVGGNDETNSGGVLFERQGGKWIQHKTPTNTPLNGVWIAKENSVFAVGGGTAPDGTKSAIVLRYNGHDWQEIPTGATAPLHDVFGPSDQDVHIVGEEGFFHYPDQINNDMIDISVHDLCEGYGYEVAWHNYYYYADIDEVETMTVKCIDWLTDVIAEGPECRDSAFALMECLGNTKDDEKEILLADPSDPNAPCAAELSQVTCTDFTMLSD